MSEKVRLLADLCAKLHAVQGLRQRYEIVASPKYSSIRQLLRIIYNPNCRFHISQAGLLRFAKNGSSAAKAERTPYKDIQALLHDLCQRRLKGNNAYASVMDFIGSQPHQYRNVLMNAIDKNLGLRLSLKSIDKAFQGGSPELLESNAYFPVALARKFNTKLLEKDGQDGWLVSRKFDGVRCLLLIDPSKSDPRRRIVALSRQGKQFNVPLLTQSLSGRLFPVLSTSTAESAFVIDGELCVLNDGEQDKENFSRTVSLVMSGNALGHDRLVFVAFDMLPLGDWKSGECEKPLADRLNQLNSFFQGKSPIVNGPADFFVSSGMQRIPWSSSVAIVEQVRYQSREQLEELFRYSSHRQWEGLIVRRNCRYQSGRTTDYLKLKGEYDGEYKVVGCRTGAMRLFIDGKDQLAENVLKSVDILHKGKLVSVGSGFTTSERIELGKNGGKDMMGRLVTVKFAGETNSAGGGISSLRFPVIKYVWKLNEAAIDGRK